MEDTNEQRGFQVLRAVRRLGVRSMSALTKHAHSIQNYISAHHYRKVCIAQLEERANFCIKAKDGEFQHTIRQIFFKNDLKKSFL